MVKVSRKRLFVDLESLNAFLYRINLVSDAKA